MKINNTYDLSFDPYGNLYITYSDKIFQVLIDGKNYPLCEIGTYNIISKYNTNLRHFKLLDKHNSLRSKIQKKIDQLENDSENDDEDDDDENSDEEYYKSIKPNYYPEDEDHIDSDDEDNEDDDPIIDEDNLNKYGVDNITFNFYGNQTICDINCREDGDIMALYDVYLYDNNNNLVFKSISSDNSSIYRFRIYSNGDIYFRVIGSMEYKYKLNIENENNLKFILCTQ